MMIKFVYLSNSLTLIQLIHKLLKGNVYLIVLSVKSNESLTNCC